MNNKKANAKEKAKSKMYQHHSTLNIIDGIYFDLLDEKIKEEYGNMLVSMNFKEDFPEYKEAVYEIYNEAWKEYTEGK